MIARDGNCISLWQATSNSYMPVTEKLPGQLFDVVIVGGGITGISTALRLQEAGKKCIVLEAASLCFGTTGGTTAHLNTLIDVSYKTIQQNFSLKKASLVFEALEKAIDKIHDNIEKYKIDCDFKLADAYLFAKTESQVKELESAFETMAEIGLPISFSETIPIPDSFLKAIKVREQAKFNPVRYVHGLAHAFETAGGVIIENCRVTGVEQNDNLEIATGKGSVRSKDIIYATHIPPGLNLLHLRCIPYRSYAMAVKLQDDKYPIGLSYDMEDPYNYYRSQEIDGQQYLIAGGRDHKTAHEENTDRCFLQLEAHLRKMFKVESIHSKWSSQFFEPADGLPYIGQLPAHPEHFYVATGYGGNGMVYSSVAATLLTDILVNNDTPYMELFDPNRIKPIAGFSNFVTHNADVVKQFAGKFFSGEDLTELVDLAPGEARMVKYEDHKLAMYKDENGKIHAVNPTCTHLKCEVRWNVAEKSWDCPCHGARYSFDGKLLTGPADHDLEEISIRYLQEH